MQVSIEETSELGRKMTVMVPNDKIENAISQRLEKLKGQVKIDGFRPGKVPLRVVKQRYGGQVRQEVMADEMQASYREAVLQEKLRPASSPQIMPESIETGKDLTFVATFDIYPEINLCDFSEQSITVPVSEVADADIDNALDRMRKQKMEWSEIDQAGAIGHRVTLDFVGSLDGEEFEGGKAEDFPMVLGDAGMIPGFEEEIVGLKAKDNKQFQVTFPEEYGNKKLAGQEVTFDITVKKVEEGNLPAFDEDFVKSFGIDDGSTDTLKAEVRKSLENELLQQVNNKTKQAVMECLLENNEFLLPDSMVSQEIAALRQQAQQNMSLENSSQLPDELFSEEAKRRVKLGLIIGEIINEQKLQVDTNLVEQRIVQIASQYSEYDQVIQYYRTDNQARASVESAVMEDQVVEWILEKTNKTEEKKTFEELVKPNN